jgi:methylenetetrahydrofolate--tRNA-(uracil-5-)-methyltransferase
MPAMSHPEIQIIGGGLAGSEAAWQGRREGVDVTLYEMKPGRYSPAHHSPYLAELVCSNSLRSESLENAAGVLKEEMRLLDSLVIRTARETAVPAGSSLAVDREMFSRRVTRELEGAGVRIVREEVCSIPEDGAPVIVATGPLPTESMACAIQTLTGSGSLFFYDAIAPIVDAGTIDYGKTFWGSRYGKGGKDYLNCPMDEDQYHGFVEAVRMAEKVPLRDFEHVPPFEGCMPIEDLVERGTETLAHGPMRPVGLEDPRTGRRAYAVVQLRQDNVSATLLNLVGFQTKMTHGEQRRVFQTIPGLEHAEFFRYGSLHRNAFFNAPRLLLPTLQLKGRPFVFFAGQMTGVEGYIESAATGILAGINAARLVKGSRVCVPPDTTATGALVHYITHADPETFQPMHVNFGIFPPLLSEASRSRKLRRRDLSARAVDDMRRWVATWRDG